MTTHRKLYEIRDARRNVKDAMFIDNDCICEIQDCGLDMTYYCRSCIIFLCDRHKELHDNLCESLSLHHDIRPKMHSGRIARFQPKSKTKGKSRKSKSKLKK